MTLWTGSKLGPKLAIEVREKQVAENHHGVDAAGRPVEHLPPSLWAATAPAPIGTTPLTEDVEADVVVVGGGFTGLSTALHLAPHLTVRVLEAKEIGWGASGRNNGLVIPTLSKPDPDEIVAAFGSETGERAVALIRDSAGFVFDLIRRHGMERAGKQVGWIQPVHTPGRMKVAEKRVEQWGRRGADVALLSRAETAARLGSEAWFGGWIANTGGTVNPLAYARGLAKAATEAGAIVHTGSPVIAIEESGDRWRVRAAKGSVLANRVVLATNAYSDDLWPGLRRSIMPVTNWQTATAPISDNIRKTIMPSGAAFSDTRGDLQFCRFDDDGRLVSGATLVMGHDTDRRIPEIVGARLKAAFLQLGEVTFDYVWSGEISATTDFLPRLHRLAPGVVAWMGCNGRGVALASAMGPILAGMVRETVEDRELPVPLTQPKEIPAHGLLKRVARARMLLFRRADAQELT